MGKCGAALSATSLVTGTSTAPGSARLARSCQCRCRPLLTALPRVRGMRLRRRHRPLTNALRWRSPTENRASSWWMAKAQRHVYGTEERAQRHRATEGRHHDATALCTALCGLPRSSASVPCTTILCCGEFTTDTFSCSRRRLGGCIGKRLRRCVSALERIRVSHGRSFGVLGDAARRQNPGCNGVNNLRSVVGARRGQDSTYGHLDGTKDKSKRRALRDGSATLYAGG